MEPAIEQREELFGGDSCTPRAWYFKRQRCIPAASLLKITEIPIKSQSKTEDVEDEIVCHLPGIFHVISRL
jgi:hypothetical protein